MTTAKINTPPASLFVRTLAACLDMHEKVQAIAAFRLGFPTLRASDENLIESREVRYSALRLALTDAFELGYEEGESDMAQDEAEVAWAAGPGPDDRFYIRRDGDLFVMYADCGTLADGEQDAAFPTLPAALVALAQQVRRATDGV
jgi:hypothetical protein